MKLILGFFYVSLLFFGERLTRLSSEVMLKTVLTFIKHTSVKKLLCKNNLH
jgi:hypothetical protein